VTEAAPGGDGLRVLLVEVPSREAGLEALERLEAAVAEGHLQVEDAAVVHRDADGRIRVLQTHGPGTRKGVVRGGAIGFVVGSPSRRSSPPRRSAPRPARSSRRRGTAGSTATCWRGWAA
jgi:hypothetical protein